ncbi:hypothetical protein Taro_049184, partial [Colocasia esculenta]|nr:hypothetical protein [Colocasia esculenta]
MNMGRTATSTYAKWIMLRRRMFLRTTHLNPLAVWFKGCALTIRTDLTRTHIVYGYVKGRIVDT